MADLAKLEAARKTAAAEVERLAHEVKAAERATAEAARQLGECTDEAEAMGLLVRQTTQRNRATALGRELAAARQAQAAAERAYTDERQDLVDALIAQHLVTLQSDCLDLWRQTLATRDNLWREFNAAGLRPPWGQAVAPELTRLDKVLSGLEAALKGLGATVTGDSSQKTVIALGETRLERYPLGVMLPVPIGGGAVEAKRDRWKLGLLSELETTLTRRKAAGVPFLAQDAD